MEFQSKLACIASLYMAFFFSFYFLPLNIVVFRVSLKENLDLQSQFLLSGAHGDGQWTVPITLSFGSYERRKKFLLEASQGRFDLSELAQPMGDSLSSTRDKQDEDSDENLWVKVNVDQSGFYRVNYEDKLAVRLRKAIQKNCLVATDKFGVYNVQVICQ